MYSIHQRLSMGKRRKWCRSSNAGWWMDNRRTTKQMSDPDWASNFLIYVRPPKIIQDSVPEEDDDWMDKYGSLTQVTNPWWILTDLFLHHFSFAFSSKVSNLYIPTLNETINSPDSIGVFRRNGCGNKTVRDDVCLG